MQFFPIIALCDRHAEELKEHLRPMPDLLDQTLQERVVRACCDVYNGDDPDRKGCEVANHWFYLHLELAGWRVKEAGARGGAAKTEAKVAAARANGAKGGRPSKHLTVL